MNVTKNICVILFAAVYLHGGANAIPTKLITGVNYLDSLSNQIVATSIALPGEPGDQIKNIASEINFYTKLRLSQINELKNLCLNYLPVKIETALYNLILHEKNLLYLFKNLQEKKVVLIDKTEAKQIGMRTDSIFIAMEKLDVTLKCKIDSLYVNASEIVNGNYYRTIIIRNKILENNILWILALFLITALTGIGYSFIKIKVNSKKMLYISAFFVFVSIAGLFNLKNINNLLGEKYFVQHWETVTRFGHQLNKQFFDMGTKSAIYPLMNSKGYQVTNFYLSAQYTAVSMDLAKDVNQNIHFINSVLFPPAQLPDSATISKYRTTGDTTYCYNPAWFCNHNYSKINAWNRMLSRKVVHGKNIDLKKYNTFLNYLLNDNFKLTEDIVNERLFKSSISKMKLENLLKIKIAL